MMQLTRNPTQLADVWRETDTIETQQRMQATSQNTSMKPGT